MKGQVPRQEGGFCHVPRLHLPWAWQVSAVPSASPGASAPESFSRVHSPAPAPGNDWLWARAQWHTVAFHIGLCQGLAHGHTWGGGWRTTGPPPAAPWETLALTGHLPPSPSPSAYLRPAAKAGPVLVLEEVREAALLLPGHHLVQSLVLLSLALQDLQAQGGRLVTALPASGHRQLGSAGSRTKSRCLKDQPWALWPGERAPGTHQPLQTAPGPPRRAPCCKHHQELQLRPFHSAPAWSR